VRAAGPAPVSEAGPGMADAKKFFLVTGACGGLGSAVTDLLAAGGSQVYAADSDGEALGTLASKEHVRPLLLDVRDSSSLSEACDLIQQSAPRLDGIVCGAGVYIGGPLLNVAEDEIRRALDVNVMGAVLVVQHLFPLLREGSRLVFISSESTRVAVPFTGPYVMSKRALEAFADTLRRELLPLGIGVTVVQPGAIRTPLLSSAARSLASDLALPIYRKGLQSAASVLENEKRTGLDPARVAQVIVHVLESRRPPLLCRIGNDPARALLSHLPARWIDALVRRFL